MRLPADEVAARFRLLDAGLLDVSHLWSFSDPEAAALWRVEPSGLGGVVTAGALRVRAGGHRVTLAGPAPPSAGCDVLEADVRGLEPNGFVSVSERGAGELARTAVRDALGADRTRFVLPLPGRSEPLGGLELALGGTGAEVEVRSIACASVHPERLAPGGSPRPWRLDVGDELRDGYLLAADRPLRLEAAAPGARHLRFAAGAVMGAGGEIEVVAVARGSGERVLERVPARVRAGRDGWRVGEIELPPGVQRVALEARLTRGGRRDLVALASVAFVGPLAAAPPRVVLVSIDTLRADRMSLYGARRETTPSLDAWARREGVVFEHAVAAAPSTLPAHASMFTGLEVLHHGAFLGHPLGAAATTLAERYRQAGFRTLAVTGGGYLHPYYGLDRGFEVYRSWPRHPGANEEELTDGLARVRRLLAEHRGEPVFLFFHTYEVHAPYRTQEPYFSTWTGTPGDRRYQPWPREDETRGRCFDWNHWPRVELADGSHRDLRPDELEDLRAAYDSGIAVVDHAVGGLLESLSGGAEGEATTLVFTADHGEALGEEGRFDHGLLYDSNLRVPLVVKRAGRRGAGRRVESPVRLVDLVPTLVELSDLPAPVAPVDGVSLVPELEGRADTAQRPAWSYSAESGQGLSVRTRGFAYVLHDCGLDPEGGGEELYRVADDADETRNLALDSPPPPELAGLRERARRYWSGALSGLFARLVAPPRSGLELRLGPHLASPLEVRGFPSAGAHVELDGEGRALVRLDPGSEVVLRFDVPPGPLEIEIPGRVRASVPWSQACSGWRAALAAPAAVTLLARGACAPGESAGAQGPGREVTDALRALGYLR